MIDLETLEGLKIRYKRYSHTFLQMTDLKNFQIDLLYACKKVLSEVKFISSV